MLDTAGELTKSYVYDAFGVEQNIDDSDSNAFRYCGEYYDAETGTVYLRARYYNPVTGRFISRDSYTGEHGDLHYIGANLLVIHYEAFVYSGTLELS